MIPYLLKHYAPSLCSHPYLINSKQSLGKGHYSYAVQEAGLATIPEYEDMEAIAPAPSLHAVNLNPGKREAWCDCNYRPDPDVMDCCRHIAIVILEYHSIDLRSIQAYHRRQSSQLTAPLDPDQPNMGMLWKFSDGELCRLLALAREFKEGTRTA